MTVVAAFDIGSTQFRSVLGSPTDGFLTTPTAAPTRPERLPEQLSEHVGDLAARASDPIEAISIAITGLPDDAGRVAFDTADGEERTIPIVEALERRYDLPISLANDCNAAVLGERSFGAGRDHDTLAHVAIGTGIGAGVYTNGGLLTGERGRAGEVGTFPIRPKGTEISTGVKGAWEAYCAGRGIPGFVAALLEDEPRATSLSTDEGLTAKAVFAAASDGDEVAREYLELIGRYNAAGIGMVISAYDPGLVTLSGSVATNNPDAVLGPIREHVDRYTILDPPSIEISTIADEIGLYGALALVDER
ncbi:ROK family protein (plasmid) [Haloferacaceae archaeon DSL9]